MRPARAVAAAKINLALVVGPRQEDGLHEVATVIQRIDVCDRIELRPGERLAVEGFAEDTIVARGLALLAAEAGVEPAWRVRISKEIPVGAGLGGGSADAAAALRLANERLPEPLQQDRLHALAATLGADVPFFLDPGPKLAEGTGERLSPLDLPQGFWVVLALPRGLRKASTREVYARFDALGGGPGFDERKERLLRRLAAVRTAGDLSALPGNDLAVAAGSAPFVAEMMAQGAFGADVSGAGPAVYGLFGTRQSAGLAARRLRRRARCWVAAAVW